MIRIWILFSLLALPLNVFAAAQNQPLQNISEYPANAYGDRLEVPPLHGRVTDLAHILEPSESEHLKAKLQLLESVTTTQLAILVIADLQGELLEEYSLKVANTWKLGRRDINNGVLILVAMKNRALRIEVGLGLESILTNEACKRIIDEGMIPFFKAGDFYRGLDSGVDSIIKILTSSQEYRDIVSGALK